MQKIHSFYILIIKENTSMVKKIILIAFIATLSLGCASIPIESSKKNEEALKFVSPSEGKFGLYIYRKGILGSALKKDVWLNGKCIGETAPNIFFYEEVEGDKEYKISTESEFSPYDLVVKVKSGMLYFIRQYIKLGLFIGGAGLEIVDDEEGKKAVSELKLAVKGTCSN